MTQPGVSPLDRGPARRRSVIILALVLITAGVGSVAVALGWLSTGGGDNSARSGGQEPSTAMARVQRRSLSTHTELNGTLGYAGAYTVLGQVNGTVTWLPKPGQVIDNGQVLYRVDGGPVVLLYGSTPAYRDLGSGDGSGADVAQLNHDLERLGYLAKAEMDAAQNTFSWATRLGVEKLQRHLDVPPTGRLVRGAVVFLPTPARVTKLLATLGGPAAGPLLSASSTSRAVDVGLDAGLQSKVKTGDRVTITLPDGSTTPGSVISVGLVASLESTDSGGSNGAPTLPVTIRPTLRPAIERLDQAPVGVSITDQSVHDVLAVPVTALLALAGGGYAVEVVARDGTHHIVAVTPGLFDDAAGLVQVSGAGLAQGQHVVVPGP